MIIATFLGVFFILVGLASFISFQLAKNDFKNRHFISLQEKSQHRKLIYLIPFGQYAYLIRMRKNKIA